MCFDHELVRFGIVACEKQDRAAADAAVLDVALLVTSARIGCGIDRLSAMWTPQHGVRIGRAAKSALCLQQ